MLSISCGTDDSDGEKKERKCLFYLLISTFCQKPENGQVNIKKGDCPYLSVIPQESIWRSLKFPRAPRWTEIRSTTSWRMEMSLMHPWNPPSGLLHLDPKLLSGQPDKNKTKVGQGTSQWIRTHSVSSLK